MLDIHTHLYWPSYDADRAAVVSRAREAGVKQLLVIGCTVEESRQAIALAETDPDMYAAVGVHPHEFNKEETRTVMEDTGWIEKLRGLARHRKVVALGECGLDYYSHDQTQVISPEQKGFQKAGFLAQVALASELRLPLIIHCRDAYQDMFEILQSARLAIPVVLHCYMGDTEVTDQFLTLPSVYFSFTGNITYPVKKLVAGTKDDLTETVKHIPLERLFVETDCPFLSPQSKRGERNEPSFVTEIAECVARLKRVDVAVVESKIEANFQKVFAQV